jgi:hypothetical protein
MTGGTTPNDLERTCMDEKAAREQRASFESTGRLMRSEGTAAAALRRRWATAAMQGGPAFAMSGGEP